ncbi:MAG: hypothetical protein KGI70_01025 [Patescibacteria group bacterium]|nr:hypothetical protein [Patescibacteria group bacterium]
MRRAVIVLIALLVVGYGLFEARKLIEGPVITIDAPKDGSATSSPLVVVVGSAQNIAFLSINDAPAYTNEAGQFVEKFAPPAGYTTVTVAAVDRFGRRALRTITINVVKYCFETHG